MGARWVRITLLIHLLYDINKATFRGGAVDALHKRFDNLRFNDLESWQVLQFNRVKNVSRLDNMLTLKKHSVIVWPYRINPWGYLFLRQILMPNISAGVKHTCAH